MCDATTSRAEHNYRTCTTAVCEECQTLVDTGLVMACDECGTPGAVEADGWYLLKDGRTLCTVCARAISADIDDLAPPA